MSARSRFAETLKGLRENAGFATPFAFYRGRDGRRTLGLSFPNYLKLERGGSLPQPRRLEPLLSALGLEAGSPQARELVRAYLQALLGSERLLEIAAGASAPDPAPPGWILAESAARQAIGQRKVALTLEQYRALARDGLAYACHVILANTRDWIESRELARLVGRPARAVAGALAVLERAGLAERSGAKARSPLAGRFVAPPAATPALAAVYASLRGHRSSWKKKTRGSHYLILRATEAAMERYAPHLADVVSMSAIYGDVKPSEDSGMYLVEARVSKLFEP